MIAVSSTSFSIVKYCRDVTGFGCLIQKKKYQSHHKQSYVWHINTSVPVLELCSALLPYLREESKWKRAKKLVSEWKVLTKRNGKYSKKEFRAKKRFEEEFFSLS